MNQTNFSNNLKRLFKISLLLIITNFGNINTYATQSLNDYLNNSDNTLKFNTNSIGNITTVDGTTTTTDITNSINSEEFVIDSCNNNTYIDVNTIQLLNNTGGGEVKASIAGSNNISLQQWTEDSTIPTSITFSGNNTNYTGTLYLHPSINTITFTNQQSIINNINFPNSIPNTGSDKDTNPFVAPSESSKINIIFKDNTNINELTINDNLITNLHGSININKLNLSNTSSLKTLPNSNITLADNSGTNSLNIGSEEYTVLSKPTIAILPYIVSAQYDYEDGKCLYHYSNTIKCSNDHEITVPSIDDTASKMDDDAIIAILGFIYCNTCNIRITPTIILQAYLYPSIQDSLSAGSGAKWAFRLYCSICNNIKIGSIQVPKEQFDAKNYTQISYFRNNKLWIADHTDCIITNNDNLIYDPTYVLEQLNKAGDEQYDNIQAT